MPQTEKYKETWTGKISTKTYQDLTFVELIVRKSTIKDSIFADIQFKNCSLGLNTQYTNCEFSNCKFTGKYGSLGRPSEFHNCKFINCTFIGADMFEGVDFDNCIISGRIKNAIFKDDHPNVKNTRTIFNNCDLSNLILDNVSIYGHEVFKKSILPKSGIRRFNNPNNILINRALQICSEIKDYSKYNSEVIFNPTLKSGQDPIILDELFLNSFFTNSNSKNLFEEIVLGYELED